MSGRGSYVKIPQVTLFWNDIRGDGSHFIVLRAIRVQNSSFICERILKIDESTF